jgi:hypothetical protein
MVSGCGFAACDEAGLAATNNSTVAHKNCVNLINLMLVLMNPTSSSTNTGSCVFRVESIRGSGIVDAFIDLNWWTCAFVSAIKLSTYLWESPSPFLTFSGFWKTAFA